MTERFLNPYTFIATRNGGPKHRMQKIAPIPREQHAPPGTQRRWQVAASEGAVRRCFRPAPSPLCHWWMRRGGDQSASRSAPAVGLRRAASFHPSQSLQPLHGRGDGDGTEVCIQSTQSNRSLAKPAPNSQRSHSLCASVVSRHRFSIPPAQPFLGSADA